MKKMSYHREPLPTCMCRPREHDRLALPEAALDQAEDQLVVNDGVCVMHAQWVRTVIEYYVRMRDALSKVCL